MFLARCALLLFGCLAIVSNAALIPHPKTTTNADFLFDKPTSGVLEIKSPTFLDILQKSEDKRPRVVLFYSPSCVSSSSSRKGKAAFDYQSTY